MEADDSRSDKEDFELLGIPVPAEETAARMRIPFEVLVTQFVDELRSGSRPSIRLYARRFPPHADRIEEVFPMLAMLEETRLARESQSLRKQMPGRFPLQVIGGCHLQEEIGRGGMGVVFRAVDPGHAQPLAVKVLPWKASFIPSWGERFQVEAETTRSLCCPGIVPVLRSGEEQGYCFLVMPLVYGVGLDLLIRELGRSNSPVSLRQLIRDRIGDPPASEHEPEQGFSVTATDWSLFLAIAISAVRALLAAHQAGICHNDIKPGNLLITADCSVRITDFGLSQSLLQPQKPMGVTQDASQQRGAVETDPSEAGGTLRYMAPERFHGVVSAETDIFSFGVTLYELCLQSAPFDDPDPERLRQKIRTGQYPHPEQIVPEFPRSVAMIIANCLAPDPVDRYRNSSQLEEDLIRAATGERVSSRNRSGVRRILRAFDQ